MTLQSVITRAIGEPIKALGFQRRGNNWYRFTSDLYTVVNVQKSDWGETCYVNIAFSPAEDIEGAWLPESKCQVRVRLDSLDTVTHEDLRLLERDSSEDVMSDDEFSSALRRKIGAPVAQFLSETTSLVELKNSLAARVSGGMFVHRKMREYLSGVN